MYTRAHVYMAYIKLNRCFVAIYIITYNHSHYPVNMFFVFFLRFSAFLVLVCVIKVLPGKAQDQQMQLNVRVCSH